MPGNRHPYRDRNFMKNERRRPRRRLRWPTGDKIAGVTQSLCRFFDPVSFASVHYVPINA
ncbi:hypothetical protein SBA3_1060010 [Candidatus Sulfopaludibacter sp. SbA3]|nr:hypothetical protein SBA3_1060010 [Candidatus Sulfopaludibacter sp. SbA3]